MWVYNEDINKWVLKEDSLSKSSFDVYKQELSSTRFYSKCLSGATYLHTNDLNNIYDVLEYKEKKNWFIPISSSKYSVTSVPLKDQSPIKVDGDYYTKNLNEYNLTLKNKFTPNKLIKDSINNFYYVDVCTTEPININSSFIDTKIDGIRLLKGHRILVKDQISKVVLSVTTDPKDFFVGNYTKISEIGQTIEYQYYNEDNGIYEYDGEFLVRQNTFSNYKDTLKYSVVVKLGSNTGKQFHLSRLLNGYYPMESEPMEFVEKKNWMLRNRVDYNNLLEINYYDSLKHESQEIQVSGITYSIPERTISVGEFGVILNTQNEFTGKSNIINNKYKVNLFSVEETDLYYWTCGEKGILLRVNKHDFEITKIDLPNIRINLNCVDFLSNNNGIVVGEFNTILLTDDGGKNWNKIEVARFSDYNYTKCIYYSPTKFFVVGENGVFIEFIKGLNGYKAYKKRISEFKNNLENEYLLVDDINDALVSRVSLKLDNDSKILDNLNITPSIKFDYEYDSQSYFYNSPLGASNLMFVDGGNGFAYSAPGRSGVILKLNLNNDTITTFGSFPYGMVPQYYYGIKSTINGKIYFFPDKSSGSTADVLVINTLNNDSLSYIPWTDLDGMSSNPSITPDGIIYGNSIVGNKFYKIDTNTDIISIINTTSTFGGGTSVYSPNGFIYFIPGNSNPKEFYKLDISTDMVETIESLDLTFRTTTSVITSDGIIYGTNSDSNKFIKIDTSDDSSMSFNISMGDKISSLVILPDDTIYGLSYLNNKLYKIDTDILDISETINITTSGTYITSKLIGNSIYAIGVDTGNKILKLKFNELPYISIEDEFLFMVTNDNKIIMYDINNNFNNFNFIYLNFNNNDYGDIISISNKENTDSFYFTSDEGLYKFDMNIFGSFDTSSDVNNTCYGLTGATNINNKYYNNLFDYKGEELILSGNESLLENYDYNTTTFNDIIDSGFSDRYKSKMLFMNYDIASKLNFFRDNGEYRLPDEVSFDITSYIDIKQPVISGVTQSNWLDYYRDSIQTFEYGNSIGLDESTKVLFSTKFEIVGAFSYNENITSSDITTELTDILELAPQIEEDRFVGTNPSSPFASKSIYLYKYLMILKINTNYPVNKGDVFKLKSTEIDTNLIVNKIFTDGPNKYLYMFSDFNENIIRSIKNNGCLVYNLNKPSDISKLVNNFNEHPISIGYELSLNTQTNLTLSAKFNNKTAYYNLACKIETNINTYDFSYTDAFINFGYSPVYNILGYLKNIDSNLFYDDKEYLAMPVYKNIPLGPLSLGGAYIDTGILNNNKLVFSNNLKFEYDSIFINTFIDINIYGSSTYTTERLLVMDKYYNPSNNSYVIEFHKKIKFDTTSNSIDIISRRKLSQISDDLRILNNIQKTSKSKEITIGQQYFVYDNELNFKIKTDSYTNILLSDQDTKDNISTIVYTDSSNELSMNVVNLDENIFPEVTSIVEYNGKVSIIFKDPHNLKDGNSIMVSYNGDGVAVATNGCYPSSSGYDPNFFGYHLVEVLSDNIIVLDIPWNVEYIVNKFEISFTKKDSFLNYTPIDLTDIGVNKIGKVAIELQPENTILKDNIFMLDKVDFNKFRYRLFDGLTINDLIVRYPWILEAEISDALIGLVDGELTWYSGIWECGRWFEGRWVSGHWLSGDFYGGTWDSKMITDKKISVEISEKNTINNKSMWFSGRWFGGEWNGGTWRSGRWYEGSFNDGIWLDGIWNNGEFNNGRFKGGIWIKGNFNNGIFNTDNKPSYWLDGNFNGGDFGNGMWYNGTFESKNNIARFGTESFNSRPSVWHGGNFVSGSFHSNLNLDDNGNVIKSRINKYSIWNTGNFISGDFYGGVVYHINFNGTWHGGVLEDIQIIEVGNITGGKDLKLNGSFKFNIGNEIILLDDDLNTFRTKVFDIEEDIDNIGKYTIISTTPDMSLQTGVNYRLVSEFSNATWKSGIWTNGVFSSGIWEGGLFYNGIFNGTSI